MERVKSQSAVLLAVIGLSLGMVPGLGVVADCAPRSGCPMMGGTDRGSHCQRADSFVADCCAMQNLPAESARVSRVVVAPGVELLKPADGDRPAFVAPEPTLAEPSPLAAKLHAIGRHTLFQVFLS